MKNKVWIYYLLMAATVVLAAVSLCLLPDTVIVQISTGGAATSTLPRLAAVAIPTALCGGGAVAGVLFRDDQKAAVKALVVSAGGLLVFILTLLINLVFLPA